MKTKIILLIMCLLTASVRAQDYNIFDQAALQVVPVSPNAASLGMYGVIPVGHYTGTAKIDIPIYEINLDGKTFPLSLSYHSSGIKVGQEASSVGLGWALTGYGCIVKEVRGWDDFEYGLGYFYYPPKLPAYTEDNNVDIPKSDFWDYYEYTYNTRDGEPDLFHFNFGDYGGTMFFGKKDDCTIRQNVAQPFIQKDKNNLYVEYDHMKKCWLFKDGDGYSYYFGTKEVTSHYFWNHEHENKHPSKVDRNHLIPRSRNEHVITAWYLDSIVSPLNNSIRFEYQEDPVYSLMQRQESIYKHLETVSTENYWGGEIDEFKSYSYSYSKISQKILKRVQTKNEQIICFLEDREDIESAKEKGESEVKNKAQRIYAISIQDKYGNPENNFYFTYEYKGDVTDYASCRLFLKELREGLNSERKIYRFNYTNTPELPDKYSNQIDYWGYYNGKKASGNSWSSSVIPPWYDDITYIPEYIAPYTHGSVKFVGRNPSVDPYYAKAGMLESIEYPTKLLTKFFFGSHIVQNIREFGIYGAGLRVDSIISEERGEIVKRTIYKYLKDDGRTSSGLLMNYPRYTYNYLLQEIKIEYDAYREPYFVVIAARYAVGMTSSYFPFSNAAMGSPVGYGRVIEKEGLGNFNRETEYIYHNVADEVIDEIMIPGFPTQKDSRNGLLQSKILYNENRVPAQATYYKYEARNKNSVKGLKVFTPPYIMVLPVPTLYAKFYDQEAITWALVKEQTDTGTPTGRITVIKEYDYTSSNDLPSKVTTTESDGSVQQILYKYPTDFNTTICNDMKAKNMLNPKMEVIRTKDGAVVSAEKVDYVKSSGFILPKTYYKLNTSELLSTSNYTSGYESIYTIDRYNSYGRMSQTTDRSGKVIVYLWGYGSQFPVMQIEGVSYVELREKIGDNLLGNNRIGTLEKSFDTKEITKICDQIRAELMADEEASVIINSFTYDPLFGVTSITDPRGLTTYYEYDGFGRLNQTYIREYGKKAVLEHYKYHYANQ